MTRSLYRRQWCPRFVSWAATFGAAGVFAIPAHGANVGDDVLAKIPYYGGGLTLTVNNGEPLFPLSTDGTVSLQTEDPNCDPTTRTCHYVLNSLYLAFTNFEAVGSKFYQSFLVINGPIPVQDDGGGIEIPPGTPAVFAWTGLDSDNNWKRASWDTWTIPEPQNSSDGSFIYLNVPNHGFSISAMFSGYLEQADAEVDATYVGVGGTQPFLNLAPHANAGQDLQACPGQNATLDGSGSTDPDGNLSIYQWSENGKVIAFGAHPSVSLAPGSHTVTLTAMDIFAGQNSDTVTVNVADTVPPTFPATLPTVAANRCLHPVLPNPGATDNCGPPRTNYGPKTLPPGSTTITWFATDGSGNTATAHQVVTIGGPSIRHTPANVTYTACDTQPGIGMATAYDYCGDPLPFKNLQDPNEPCAAHPSTPCLNSLVNNAPRTFDFGHTTVTWTATDSAGQQATSPQEVYVTAVDLGVEHAVATVANNACLRVTQYPAWWAPYLHALIVQAQATGTGWPIPLTYTNCGSNNGSGSLTGPWQQVTTRPVSASCPTIIKLGGNGAGSVALAWWGNG